MNYLKKIVVIMLLGCFLHINCEAAVAYSVKYDTDLGKAIVSGTTEKPNVSVTLEVLKIGSNPESLKNLQAENADVIILRYDQCVSNDEGDFKFSFSLPEESITGEYITRVAWSGNVVNDSLFYITQEDFARAMLAVNNASEDELMINIIEKTIPYFGLNNPYYADLSENEKKIIASTIKDKRGTGYETVEDFALVFSEVMAIAAVNDIALGYDELNVIEYFEDVLKLKDLASYGTFDNLSEPLKKEIIKSVSAEGRVGSLASYRTRFEEKTVIVALNNVQGYDKVDKVLQDNNHILNIDFTLYNKLSNKSAVNKKMTSVKFNSISEILNTFNSNVATEWNNQTSGTTQGGGNGSGAGGGAGGSIPSTFVSTGTEIPISQNIKGFKDLNEVEWARGSIEKLAEKNIINGKGNNIFDPMSTVTRAEFVKMLVVALGIEDNNATCSFDDVNKESWYYHYVASAVENKLIYGTSDKIFGSGENISKQDMATLLLRAGVLKGVDFNNLQGKTFNDSNEISNYALESVNKLSAAGVISGTDTGCFEPKKGATRAEAAVMLVNFLDLLEDR